MKSTSCRWGYESKVLETISLLAIEANAVRIVFKFSLLYFELALLFWMLWRVVLSCLQGMKNFYGYQLQYFNLFAAVVAAKREFSDLKRLMTTLRNSTGQVCKVGLLVDHTNVSWPVMPVLDCHNHYSILPKQGKKFWWCLQALSNLLV